MASLYRIKTRGTWAIDFALPGCDRRTIHLGRIPRRAAEQIHGHVEALITSRTHAVPLAGETAAWVRGLAPPLARKLAKVDLISQRGGPDTLDAFIADYIASRTDVKPVTRVGFEQARRRLMAFFSPDTPMRDVTPADADRWLIFLREKKYAEATRCRTLKRARQFFTAAKRARLISDNPFEGIKPGSMRNPARLFFVPAEWARKLIEACPDADWRAIVALCRFGGLRCPSEVLALTWGDVDWDAGRFLVRASKTEHHEHRGM